MDLFGDVWDGRPLGVSELMSNVINHSEVKVVEMLTGCRLDYCSQSRLWICVMVAFAGVMVLMKA